MGLFKGSGSSRNKHTLGIISNHSSCSLHSRFLKFKDNMPVCVRTFKRRYLESPKNRKQGSPMYAAHRRWMENCRAYAWASVCGAPQYESRSIRMRENMCSFTIGIPLLVAWNKPPLAISLTPKPKCHPYNYFEDSTCDDQEWNIGQSGFVAAPCNTAIRKTWQDEEHPFCSIDI